MGLTRTEIRLKKNTTFSSTVKQFQSTSRKAELPGITVNVFCDVVAEDSEAVF